tara:strand:+ start:135 stop:557 length:423 start_codon:yes stop_codon:yes gene_type:complete
VSLKQDVALVPELSCSDFAASSDFYLRILGFEILFQRPERKFACITLGQARVMIKQENQFWTTGEMQTPYGRGINFQITVADALRLSERIQAFGFPLFEALETSWYRVDQIERGVSEFLVQDPDGYLLRFSQLLGDRAVT